MCKYGTMCTRARPLEGLGGAALVDGVLQVSVTPGFKNKTECITICISESSFIHIETL